MSVVIVKTSEPESIGEIMKITPAVHEICDMTDGMSKAQLVTTLAMEIDCWCTVNDGCYKSILEMLNETVTCVNEECGMMPKH